MADFEDVDLLSRPSVVPLAPLAAPALRRKPMLPPIMTRYLEQQESPATLLNPITQTPVTSKPREIAHLLTPLLPWYERLTQNVYARTALEMIVGMFLGICIDRFYNLFDLLSDKRWKWMRIVLQVITNFVVIGLFETYTPWLGKDWLLNTGMIFAVQSYFFDDLKYVIDQWGKKGDTQQNTPAT